MIIIMAILIIFFWGKWAVFFLFVCLDQHKQFSCYLAAVTFIGDKAENLDLCLELMAFSFGVHFTRQTFCERGLRFIRFHQKDRHSHPTF
jgi:hypothetical protein